MSFNLTAQQKNLAHWIVQNVRAGKLSETFYVLWKSMLPSKNPHYAEIISQTGQSQRLDVNRGTLEALSAEALIRTAEDTNFPETPDNAGVMYITPRVALRCTVTERLYKAVDTSFAEDKLVVSSLAQPHPSEIAISLDRLRSKYSEPNKLGFLIMRFTATKPFERLVNAIKTTGKKHGLVILRADEHEWHADLWGNVRTLLHGCGFGIAVYERIETEEPNANVGLEVGYLMAMNKPVLLLKDETVKALQSDLAGKLYKPFNPHDPENTIPEQLTKWLGDNGIIVPGAKKGH